MSSIVEPCLAYRPMAEVMEEILAIEAKTDLYGILFDGWSVWPLVRFRVERILERRPLDGGGAAIPKMDMLSAAWRNVIRLTKPMRASILVKTYSTALAESVGRQFKDVYFDDLIAALPERVFKIESRNSLAFRQRSQREWIPADMTMLLSALLDYRLVRRVRPRGAVEAANALVRNLERSFGTKSIEVDSVKEALRQFYWMKRAYRAILRIVRPRRVLVADPGEYPLVAAAKELAIKVIELQHGFVSRHYPGYAWPRSARVHRGVMPVADVLAVYGEHWRREILCSGFWREDEVVVTGSLRVDEYRSRRRVRPKIPGAPISLVLTSQGTDTENLIRFVDEFLRISGGISETFLTIKLHPGYDSRKELFKNLEKEHRNVVVVAAEKEPSTFELIAAADMHASIFSTCHYEAIGLGVPTAVLPLKGNENVAALCASGHAYRVGSPLELVALAKRARELRIPDGVGDSYFCRDSLRLLRSTVSA